MPCSQKYLFWKRSLLLYFFLFVILEDMKRLSVCVASCAPRRLGKKLGNQLSQFHACKKTITEVKRKFFGGEQKFELDLWLKTEKQVVGKWIAAPDNPYGMEPGAWSWGVWHVDWLYGAYRIHSADGTLKGYRLDALTEVEIRENEIRFSPHSPFRNSSRSKTENRSGFSSSAFWT